MGIIAEATMSLVAFEQRGQANTSIANVWRISSGHDHLRGAGGRGSSTTTVAAASRPPPEWTTVTRSGVLRSAQRDGGCGALLALGAAIGRRSARRSRRGCRAACDRGLEPGRHERVPPVRDRPSPQPAVRRQHAVV
jgi:hypothetical protein